MVALTIAKVFIIDTALPSDVEPAVGDIDAAFVYDLADLERVALKGRISREAAAVSTAPRQAS